MIPNSKISQIVIEAFKRGYRITPKGEIIGVKGRVLKGHINTLGYKVFSLRYNQKPEKIEVHKLQAYQKFGDKVFDETLQIRHLNSDSGDNSWDNIGLGTPSQNQMDKPGKVRKEMALHAAKFQRKFVAKDIKKMRQLRKKGYYLKDIGELFGISKGHVSDIVNRKLYQEVK